jgi:hypothetical protein
MRWKIIVVSIILIAQFVPMECLNITTAEGKLSVHKLLYGRDRYKAVKGKGRVHSITGHEGLEVE